MTKKNYIRIARAIAHTEVAGNLTKEQSKELRSTFKATLWQDNDKFDSSKFEQYIDKVLAGMYEDFLEDQKQ